MYELNKIGERTYYIEAPAKIGLYVEDDGTATLIDSGNDKEAGRKINQHLKENDWKLKLIINTHSNADHIGGNAFLQQRTGCEIRSTSIENAFTAHPLLESSFLFGGFPPKVLRNKFLMAQQSEVTGDLSSGLPEGFEIIDLPGHFFNMIGVRTPDDIVFLADCVSDISVLNKYHINFIYDIGQYLATLNFTENLSASLFVPSHAEPTKDIRPLAKANREKVHEIIALILLICKVPDTIEGIMKSICDHFDLTLDFNQYVLVGSTIKSYLSYLLDAGGVAASFNENRLVFETI